MFTFFLPYSTIIFSLADVIEISFFSTTIYYFSQWLLRDKHKPLVWYFYGYIICFVGAQALSLHTLFHVLYLFAPATLIFFLLIHQHTLQKNFVAMMPIKRKIGKSDNWTATLLQSSLDLMNRNKDIFVVIEKEHSLAAYISHPFFLDTPVTTELLHIFTTSDSFDCHKMIWCTTHGTLNAINSSWKQPSTIVQQKNLTDWYDLTCIYTHQTDACAFHLDPTTRLFTFVYRGEVHPDFTATQAEHFLQTFAETSKTQKATLKGVCHENNRSHHSQREHTS